MSGVSLVSYWVSTALWDAVSYLLPASLALALFALFGVDEFIGAEPLLPTALLLLAYGPAVAALTYCLTFAFSHHAAAQNAVLLLHLFSGLLLSLASFIMSLIRNTRKTNHTLKVRRIFKRRPGRSIALDHDSATCVVGPRCSSPFLCRFTHSHLSPFPARPSSGSSPASAWRTASRRWRCASRAWTLTCRRGRWRGT